VHSIGATGAAGNEVRAFGNPLLDKSFDAVELKFGNYRCLPQKFSQGQAGTNEYS
jgi:hypothetical protein